MDISDNLKETYSKDTTMRAFDAQRRAYEITYGPILFQVARIMRHRGLYEMLDEAKDDGLTLEEMSTKSGMSLYAVKVLLESSLTTGTVYRKDDRFVLSKVGWFLANEERLKVDMDFNQDVNYIGWFDLEKALDEGKPAGLRHFGSWPTIYEGLSQLPADAQRSWMAFDHYYSDNSFDEAMDILFAPGVTKILDVGGNTGRFALECVKRNADVHVTVMDLPQQLEMMRRQIAGQEGADRIDGYAGNLLDTQTKLPEGYDAVWMSQFLDCFSEEQVSSILKRTAEAMDSHARLYIMETIWDRQRYATTAFCLTQISLYFSAMANGNSKMFNAADLTRLIEGAGLAIERVESEVGLGKHSIVICRKA
jgi:2-polyprenyl-3-methyl-5-hydroxy-6-metoxy-1,4-benzoquinol methylase